MIMRKFLKLFYKYIFTQPLRQEQDATKNQFFKWGKASLIQSFPSLRLVALPNLPTVYL